MSDALVEQSPRFDIIFKEMIIMQEFPLKGNTLFPLRI